MGINGLKAQSQPSHHYSSLGGMVLTIEATGGNTNKSSDDSEKLWKVAVDRDQVVLEL